jgi:hypothetical protein
MTKKRSKYYLPYLQAATFLAKIQVPFHWWGLMSQPYVEKGVRMRLTLPKWELGSPLRLLKLQSAIARVKTPRIGAFFISLEIYQRVDVENGLA